MSFKTIHDLLDDKLQTTVGLPTLQKENTLFQPANMAAWCRSTLLPASTSVESIGVGGREKKYGLYQCDLFYINNGGYSDALTMADAVIETFSKGQYLADATYSVLILRSYVYSARPFGNYYQLPVLVDWECFV